LRYFITFACYGARLHGDESGSVDRHHNLPGSRLLGSDSLRALSERQSMEQPPYRLDRESRTAVLSALRGHCMHRGWSLLEAHVRTNHVHAIVEADVRPEKLMNEFKSYASRELNLPDRDGLDRDVPDRKRWAGHGSTRWLWKDEDLQQALQYVVEEQGEPMALFIAETL
jgi:REP element-mobilizing transposase RayT